MGSCDVWIFSETEIETGMIYQIPNKTTNNGKAVCLLMNLNFRIVLMNLIFPISVLINDEHTVQNFYI